MPDRIICRLCNRIKAIRGRTICQSCHNEIKENRLEKIFEKISKEDAVLYLRKVGYDPDIKRFNKYEIDELAKKFEKLLDET